MNLQQSNPVYKKYFIELFEMDRVESSDIHRVVAEKVTLLSQEDKMAVHHFVMFGNDMIREDIPKETVLKNILAEEEFDYEESQYVPLTSEMKAAVIGMFEPYYNLLNGIKSLNLTHTDAHGDNLGWNAQGDLVILDIGGLKY
jgi:hypothetical protein